MDFVVRFCIAHLHVTLNFTDDLHDAFCSPTKSRLSDAMDFEATEDPLKSANGPKIIENEDDEGGAGVDYRRMFKGYSPPFSSTLTSISKDKKKFQTIPKRGEKDFEPDGTKKQKNLLQEGREAMYSALSFDAGLYTQKSLSSRLIL